MLELVVLLGGCVLYPTTVYHTDVNLSNDECMKEIIEENPHSTILFIIKKVTVVKIDYTHMHIENCKQNARLEVVHWRASHRPEIMSPTAITDAFHPSPRAFYL